MSWCADGAGAQYELVLSWCADGAGTQMELVRSMSIDCRDYVTRIGN